MKKFLIIILLPFLITLLVLLIARGGNFAVLNPQGPIALQERNLMLIAALLSIIVIVPVFTMLFFFSIRYKEGNHKAKYTPNWGNNTKLEIIWWAIPCIIIAILAVITWKSSHSLDPYKPLSSAKKPLTIQVVALDWKWLFIYPTEHIATVNFVEFPATTPIVFDITSDAPMNSFWIPQLSGQIYAMPGMSTQLHLLATNPGNFQGSSANISGKGFAGMTFQVKAVSQQTFDQWVQTIKKSPQQLTQNAYNALAKPSENNPVSFYQAPDSTLYTFILMKYLKPTSSSYLSAPSK